MNADQGTDPISSKLRLFLSVDVVGSTAYKQAHTAAFNSDADLAKKTMAEPWFSPISHFYREMERLFSKEWDYYCNSLATKYGWPKGPSPELWKSAGDELLYTKILTDHREALACVYYWKKAIQIYRATFRENYRTLDLKSAAWMAGFPITNTEVVFRLSVGGMSEDEDEDDNIYRNLSLLHELYEGKRERGLIRDFIGPSLDIGFRLCGLATPRKFVISVDLALMLVQALRTIPPGIGTSGFQIHYDSRVPLKGVLGGADYPVFWIDMSPSRKVEEVEDKLLKIEAGSTDHIKEFCEAFIEENNDSIIIPYIVNNPDPYFAKPPDHHDLRLKALRSYYDGETARRLDEKRAFDAEDGLADIDAAAIEELVNSIEIDKDLKRSAED